MHLLVKLILKQKLSWQPLQDRWLREKGSLPGSLLSAVTLNPELRPEGPWQWQWQEVRAQPAAGVHVVQTKQRQTVTEGDAEKDDNSGASSCPLGNLGSLSLLLM